MSETGLTACTVCRAEGPVLEEGMGGGACALETLVELMHTLLTLKVVL